MERAAQSRIPAGFTAEALGQAVTGINGFSLISYLTSPLAIGTACDYIIFGDNSTPLEFIWSIQNKVDNTLQVFAPESNGVFRYSPSTAGEFSISVEIKRNGTLAEKLTIGQNAIKPDPLLEKMLNQSLAGSLALGAVGGNPAVSREIINNFRDYVISSSWETGTKGIYPGMIASIMYLQILKKPYTFDDGIFGMNTETGRNEELDSIANDISINNLTGLENTGCLGVGGITAYAAAAAIGLIPLTPLPKNMAGNFAATKQIEQNFRALTNEQKIDVFNLIRFPKANCNVTALFLNKIKNLANRWPNVLAKDLADFTKEESKRAFQVIATEFFTWTLEGSNAEANINALGQGAWEVAKTPVITMFFNTFNTYLLDDSLNLKLNDVDKTGELMNSGKNANVPESYVYDLQKDLVKLGFVEAGDADGVFNQKTLNALRTFQRVAYSGYRKTMADKTIKETRIFNQQNPTDIVDKETRDEIKNWLKNWYSRPALYGCYLLQQGDRDSQKTWGTVKREDDPGTYVAELQQDLVRLGYWVSDPSSDNGMKIDGALGSICKGSIWLFQREHSLPTTGRLDLDTAFKMKEKVLALKADEVYARPGYQAPGNVNILYQLPPSLNYIHYSPYYNPNGYLDDIWGRKELIECLQTVANTWVATGHEILYFGDISCDDGSGPQGHDHVRGEMVDVTHDVYCRITYPNGSTIARYNKELARELVQLFLQNKVKQILFNCKYIIDNFPDKKVRAWKDHHNHYHVDYYREEVTSIQAAWHCQDCKRNVKSADERAVLDSEWTALSAALDPDERNSYDTQPKKDDFVKQNSLRCFYENRVK